MRAGRAGEFRRWRGPQSKQAMTREQIQERELKAELADEFSPATLRLADDSEIAGAIRFGASDLALIAGGDLPKDNATFTAPRSAFAELPMARDSVTLIYGEDEEETSYRVSACAAEPDGVAVTIELENPEEP